MRNIFSKFALTAGLMLAIGGDNGSSSSATGGGGGSSSSGGWTAISDSKFGTDNITAIAYGNGKFVAGGAKGQMAYSTGD